MQVIEIDDIGLQSLERPLDRAPAILSRTIQAGEALLSSGLIDSFSLMDVALFVEDNFGVRIEDTELNADTFDNLTQLASLIESRQ